MYHGGLYFVTICTEARFPLFGQIVDGQIRLSPAGQLAADLWNEVACVRPGVVADAFVVMPDHVHLLFGLVAVGLPDIGGAGTACRAPTTINGGGPPYRRTFGAPVSGTVSTIIGGYKSAVTRAIRLDRGIPDLAVWQRGYHDRVVQTDREADNVRRYIADNPSRWRPTHRHP